ncbi:MAG: CarD family transcriptional regulator [Oscillospiraceae bacterium]|jgi:CarD family transcriptional regulator|nr:CarD family transcriptional regulator [Oscillospiraceae bacterium]
MYKIGDLIFYGRTGVCHVSDLVTQADKELYILEPLYCNYTISTPVDTKTYMRPIIAKEEAERLIDTIPTVKAEPYHSRVIRELTGHYDESLKTNNCADLIALTMSIYEKKQDAELQKRKLGAIDEKYMKRSEELLFVELAAALGIDKDDVPKYIAERLEERKGEQ